MSPSAKIADAKTSFNRQIRIYFEDTDAGGIVYHANYLKYFERARTDWLRHAGISQQKMSAQLKVMFVLKSAQLDYHLPAQLDDELTMTTVVEKLGRASILFVQEAWRGNQCLVGGRFKVGCVDEEAMRPCAIPPDVFNAIHLTYFSPEEQKNILP